MMMMMMMKLVYQENRQRLAEYANLYDEHKTPNVGQNHNLMVYNRHFENVLEFTYLETTVRNRHGIHEES
jgi:hypothetical protein